MKVIMVCNTEIVPGKMAEYIELEKEMSKVSEGADSFAAMDKFAAKGFAPEFMEIMNKSDSIIKTHQHDVFIETPIP
jgi:hypothetical protein